MAYNDYNISQKKLNVLNQHKRFAKKQIKELERKQQILDKVDLFFAKADLLNLGKDKWDLFPVNLENEFYSFSDLSNIISQTQNSNLYYFKPDYLYINQDKTKKSPGKKIDGFKDINKEADNDINTGQSSDSTRPGDVILSLKGSFLIRSM